MSHLIFVSIVQKHLYTPSSDGPMNDSSEVSDNFSIDEVVSPMEHALQNESVIEKNNKTCEIKLAAPFEDDPFNVFEVIDVFEEDCETIGMVSEGTKSPVLRDSTNFEIGAKKVTEFFVSPPTPKRNPKHRNYANRTHIVLTAAERLEEMRLFEERKQQEIELKKKRAELRDIRKKEKENIAEERTEKKKQREMNKQIANQLKEDKALKRKQKREKKEAEKNNKKQKVLNIIL